MYSTRSEIDLLIKTPRTCCETVHWLTIHFFLSSMYFVFNIWQWVEYKPRLSDTEASLAASVCLWQSILLADSRSCLSETDCSVSWVISYTCRAQQNVTLQSWVFHAWYFMQFPLCKSPCLSQWGICTHFQTNKLCFQKDIKYER